IDTTRFFCVRAHSCLFVSIRGWRMARIGSVFLSVESAKSAVEKLRDGERTDTEDRSEASARVATPQRGSRLRAFARSRQLLLRLPERRRLQDQCDRAGDSAAHRWTSKLRLQSSSLAGAQHRYLWRIRRHIALARYADSAAASDGQGAFLLVVANRPFSQW